MCEKTEKMVYKSKDLSKFVRAFGDKSVYIETTPKKQTCSGKQDFQ